MMIGGHHLARSVRPFRCGAASENCKIGLATRGVSVARCFHVAKDLIVSAIFLDDVNDMLDRAWLSKELGGRKSHQPVVLQSLLRVTRERRQVRQGHHADVSRNNRAAVLPALPVL